MISRSITQVFTWKSESVRVKRGCKFWPWRPCLRAIFFKRKVHRTVPCLQGQRGLAWWYWNITKRSRISAGEIPKLCDKTKLPTQYIDSMSQEAEKAEERKAARYAGFADNFKFVPLGFETFGSWGRSHGRWYGRSARSYRIKQEKRYRRVF